MADGEPIGLLLVLTYSTAAPVVTYTGIIDLRVLGRDFTFDVWERDYNGLRVLPRDFTLDVEDR